MPNTSCGNTLINLLVDLYCIDTFTTSSWSLMATGDDCWGCSTADLKPSTINKLTKQFTDCVAELGMKLEPKFSKDIYQTEYCSSYFVPVLRTSLEYVVNPDAPVHLQYKRPRECPPTPTYKLTRKFGKTLVSALVRNPSASLVPLREWA